MKHILIASVISLTTCQPAAALDLTPTQSAFRDCLQRDLPQHFLDAGGVESMTVAMLGQTDEDVQLSLYQVIVDLTASGEPIELELARVFGECVKEFH